MTCYTVRTGIENRKCGASYWILLFQHWIFFMHNKPPQIHDRIRTVSFILSSITCTCYQNSVFPLPLIFSHFFDVSFSIYIHICVISRVYKLDKIVFLMCEWSHLINVLSTHFPEKNSKLHFSLEVSSIHIYMNTCSMHFHKYSSKIFSICIYIFLKRCSCHTFITILILFYI